MNDDDGYSQKGKPTRLARNKQQKIIMKLLFFCKAYLISEGINQNMLLEKEKNPLLMRVLTNRCHLGV